MSYFDDASLVMIPSGTKTSKAYSVKPIDGTGDLTFSRSNDTATRVNSAGLIEKVRTNLILQSNSFDTTWATSGTTLTSGQTGYDGLSDAWLLSKDAAANRYIFQSLSVSEIKTFSVYAKANTLNNVRLYSTTGTSSTADFSLVDGSLLASVSILGSSSEDLGNGWWRFSITTDGTASLFRIYPDPNGTTAGSIYFQNAQAETGDIATDYIATTSAAVSVGPLANVPRLDYLGSSCPRLLLEPQTTALNQFSEQIDNAWWSNTRVTISANATATLDPSGYNGSDLMVQDAADTNGGAFFRILTFAAGAHTWSVFAKMDEVRYINLGETASAGSLRRTWFDLQNGVVGTTNAGHTASIENYGNGWYRCSITFTATAGNYAIFTYLSDADNSTTAVVSKGSYFWGANLTATSYLQSYIPTLGAAVTRGADAASNLSASSILNDSEGTLFMEVQGNIDPASRALTLSNGTSLQRVQIFYQGSTNITTNVIYNGTSQVDLGVFTKAIDQTQNLKVIIRYASNNAKMFVNGEQVASDTSVTTPTGLNKISFDNGIGASSLQGKLKQLLYFPTALSDADCIALTA